MRIIGRIRFAALFICVFSCGLLHPAAAQETGPAIFVIFPERQKERRASRWTLSDWLGTKQKIAEQNMWLSAHTNKLPIDLTLGLDSRAGGLSGVEADVYLLSLGIKLRYERPWSAMEELWPAPATRIEDPGSQSGEVDLQLRLFGGNVQNTNLIIRGTYEYDHYYDLSVGNGPYAGFGVGPELQIYFAQWLGLRGEWRTRFLRKNIANRAQEFSGKTYWVGAFLEMGSLRFEVGKDWRERSFQTDSGALLLSEVDSAMFGRMRLFF